MFLTDGAGPSQGCQQQPGACFQLLQSSSCSFVLWQLLLSHLGFGPGFLTFHPRPYPWTCRSWRWSYATGWEDGYWGRNGVSLWSTPWKATLLTDQAKSDPCGAHPDTQNVWLLSILHGCCIWSCVISETLFLFTVHLQRPASSVLHRKWLMSICWMSDQRKSWIWPAFLWMT